MMKKAGITLLGIGLVVFLFYLGSNFFTDPSYSLLLKIAVGAVGVGVILLAVSLIIKKIKEEQKKSEKKAKRIER